MDVSINATPSDSLEVEEVDSVEVRINSHTYVISTNDKGHLVIESIDQQALRVQGFKNQIATEKCDRISQSEIIVGNMVVLS
jgi:hypothetical protein